MYEKERFTEKIAIEDFMNRYFDEERFLKKCRECPGFSKTWACPQFDFAPEDYWKQFSVYQIICDRISMEGVKSPEEAKERLFREKPFFNKEMLKLEKDTPGSRALLPGSCKACKSCARLLGEDCRFPEIMRPSIEALGGCGVKMVSDLFGFDVLWSDGKSIPLYYIMLGGLLKN